MLRARLLLWPVGLAAAGLFLLIGSLHWIGSVSELREGSEPRTPGVPVDNGGEKSPATTSGPPALASTALSPEASTASSREGVVVQVVESGDRPVAEAELLLRDPTRRAWRPIGDGAFTDAHGFWVQRRPDPGIYHLGVRKNGYIPAQCVIRVQEGSWPSPQVVRIGRGAAVEGRVVDARGTPIVGARVELGFANSSRSSISRAEGRFRFNGVSTDATQLRIRVSAPGFLPYERRSEALVESEVRSLVPIVLDGGARIRGRVVDEQGVAVRNAEILVLPVTFQDRYGYVLRGHELTRDEQRYVRHRPDSVRSDGVGRFEIAGLYEDEYRLRARATGYSRGTEETTAVASSGETTLHELVLRRGEFYEAQVIHDDGEPVSGAEIGITANDGIHRETTSLTGQFRFNALPPGKVTLQVSRGQVLLEPIVAESPALLPTRIVLSRGGELIVNVEAPGPVPPQIEVVLRDEAGAEVRSWSVLEDGRAVFSDLPAGDYQASLRSPDHRGDIGPVILDEGASVARTAMLELIPARAVVVEVNDPEGRPVSGASIALGAWEHVAAGADGRASLEVRQSTLRLTISAPGYCRLTRQISEPEIAQSLWSITLLPAGSLRVRVAGDPEGTQVVLVPLDGTVRGGLQRYMRTLGPDGETHFEGLWPGRYRVDAFNGDLEGTASVTVVSGPPTEILVRLGTR